MLARLRMVGVSWRQSGSESLAEFTLDEDVVAPRLRAFAERLELSGLAYLSTCNRVELVFARSDRMPVGDLRGAALELLTGRAAGRGEAEHRLRAWQGEGVGKASIPAPVEGGPIRAAVCDESRA